MTSLLARTSLDPRSTRSTSQSHLKPLPISTALEQSGRAGLKRDHRQAGPTAVLLVKVACARDESGLAGWADLRLLRGGRDGGLNQRPKGRKEGRGAESKAGELRAHPLRRRNTRS